MGGIGSHVNAVLLFALAALLIFQVHADYMMYLTNNLGPGKDLTAHCRNDNIRAGIRDLGTHVLKFSQNFTWVSPLDPWQNTTYWCDMTKPNSARATFNIYNETRDFVLCTGAECYWRVDEDAIYIHDNLHKHWVLQYHWPQ
ncbi:S-protein homolog 18-like [Punica granatum]|uniref:S-protein homolog n=2 Tax=Punica granatum TaxID=22663 RepID=A0A218XQC8_PUNGR|nr:S-protein homolog 18-like [Punica granatum]OWM86462.1 hypothetical protein CDL15_Pgr026354 [Punica granatum]PKI51900.1 hypothetical protein CRG98_027733 [Punica granatum]